MHASANPTTDPANGPVLPARPLIGRPRFAGFSFSKTPAGRCTAEVTLELDGTRFVGSSSGMSSTLVDLRVAAEACVHALESLCGDAVRFELLGVKHVRAFDADLAIVSINESHAAGTARLVGCYLVGNDIRRGTAIAVLNATNRVLGGTISPPVDPT